MNYGAIFLIIFVIVRKNKPILQGLPGLATSFTLQELLQLYVI
jgi:hypothetical protein